MLHDNNFQAKTIPKLNKSLRAHHTKLQHIQINRFHPCFTVLSIYRLIKQRKIIFPLSFQSNFPIFSPRFQIDRSSTTTTKKKKKRKVEKFSFEPTLIAFYQTFPGNCAGYVTDNEK